MATVSPYRGAGGDERLVMLESEYEGDPDGDCPDGTATEWLSPSDARRLAQLLIAAADEVERAG